MSSRTQSGKTVAVAQDENENGVDAEAGTERCATRFRERGNEATNEHVTPGDTFTAPTSVTQREGESGLGRDNIALDVREDDAGGVTSPVASQVASDEILAQVGATESGQPTVTSKQRELDIETEQGENVVYMGNFDFADTGDDPYDWTCAFDDQSRTLEQEERAAGVEAEFDRHHDRAHAAHERGEEPEQATAAATKRLAQSWLPDPRGTTVGEVREEMAAEASKPHPRERTSKEVAGEIYTEAKRIREQYAEACPKTHRIATDIAERVAAGDELNEAILAADEHVGSTKPISGQRQYIANVSKWQWDATIEGEVVTLWEPNDPASQQQVGLVDDGSGQQCKVTVWNNSYEETILHEGDRVRIIDGEPDRYNGRPTLAVSGRTEIQVLEEGDGPATRSPRRTDGVDVPETVDVTINIESIFNSEGAVDGTDTDAFTIDFAQKDLSLIHISERAG
ncbi:SOSS complex subunit B family protein, partial [Halococcus thailandensis]